MRYVKGNFSLRMKLSVDMPPSVLYLASDQMRGPAEFPLRNYPQYAMKIKVCGPQSQSGCLAEARYKFSFAGIELWLARITVQSLRQVRFPSSPCDSEQTKNLITG